MILNIETLDKKVFNIALQEEIERQTMNQKMVKSQIEDGYRFDGDAEVIEEIDRLKESFKKMKHKRKSTFEISDEEFMFLERLTKNQTIISNSRIKDWTPNGSLARYFKIGYFENNKDANEETWEETRLKMIQYDVDLKNCMKELSNILGINYDENLS